MAAGFHHYHMLQWAEIETRELTREASKRDKISSKLESAQSALEVVDFALRSYPDEAALLDSRHVLLELVSTIKASDLIERAEKAAFKGNAKRALGLYQDALFLLQRQDPEMQREVTVHVNEQIDTLRRLTTGLK